VKLWVAKDNKINSDFEEFKQSECNNIGLHVNNSDVQYGIEIIVLKWSATIYDKIKDDVNLL
jgi:hypothetical protein